MRLASDHASDCGWHLDQYPQECDCGIYQGKLGRVLIDRQVFEAMYATLYRKKHVFKNYGDLHALKATDEGHRKAKANLQHAEDIALVLNRVDHHRRMAKPTPYLDMLDIAHETACENGHHPVAFVMTKDFRRKVMTDIQSVYATTMTPQEMSGIANKATYLDCELITIDEQHMHTALVCCSEKSPILKLARQMLRDG